MKRTKNSPPFQLLTSPSQTNPGTMPTGRLLCPHSRSQRSAKQSALFHLPAKAQFGFMGTTDRQPTFKLLAACGKTCRFDTLV
jgi:hypothetical protein